MKIGIFLGKVKSGKFSAVSEKFFGNTGGNVKQGRGKCIIAWREWTPLPDYQHIFLVKTTAFISLSQSHERIVSRNIPKERSMNIDSVVYTNVMMRSIARPFYYRLQRNSRPSEFRVLVHIPVGTIRRFTRERRNLRDLAFYLSGPPCHSIYRECYTLISCV